MPDEPKLGDRVRDWVTGYVGVASARVEYLNGCVQFCVEPEYGTQGFSGYENSPYIDIQRLVVVDRYKSSLRDGVPENFLRDKNGGFSKNHPKKSGR